MLPDAPDSGPGQCHDETVMYRVGLFALPLVLSLGLISVCPILLRLIMWLSTTLVGLVTFALLWFYSSKKKTERGTEGKVVAHSPSEKSLSSAASSSVKDEQEQQKQVAVNESSGFSLEKPVSQEPSINGEPQAALKETSSAHPRQSPQRKSSPEEGALQEGTEQVDLSPGMKDPMDDLDDLLDEAADDFDLDGFLDDAADEVEVESEKAKAPRSNVVPKVWQEALNCLTITEKLEWASTIQDDISRQSGTDYRYRVFSPAYKNNTRLIWSTKEDVIVSVLRKKVSNTLINSLAQDSAVLYALKMQMKRDLKGRIEAVPLDAENIKAEPQRFPRCASLIS